MRHPALLLPLISLSIHGKEIMSAPLVGALRRCLPLAVLDFFSCKWDRLFWSRQREWQPFRGRLRYGLSFFVLAAASLRLIRIGS
jgi:hypothetical protein